MSHSLSRRTFLRATAATGAVSIGSAAPGLAAGGGRSWPFRALDDEIRARMPKYAIPGVALGVLHRGPEYVRGPVFAVLGGAATGAVSSMTLRCLVEGERERPEPAR